MERDKQPKYKGEIKNNNPDGKGTSTYPNGDKYVGEWKDGERNGQGTFTWSNGRKYEGEWKDGKMWKGTEYDKNGNYVWKYVNGEIE